MSAASELRLVLRTCVSQLRVTKIVSPPAGSDDGAIFVGPRVCWAAGLAEFEQVEVCNLSRASRFFAHVRFGTEGEVRFAGTGAVDVDIGDRVKLAAYTWKPADTLGAHLATLAKVDDRNHASEFRQVKPRSVELDPQSFPPLPAIEVIVDLSASIPAEVMD